MLSGKKRLFIAVDISDSTREILKRDMYKKGDFGRVSWVKPENMHITLKFLGDVVIDDIDKIIGIMDKSVLDKEKASLRYAKLGVFPDFLRPRVLWVGYEEDSDALKSIVDNLEDELSKALGIAKERRSFTPHLTVARIKGDVDQTKLADFTKKWAGLKDDSFFVSQIVLYSSDLNPSGAVYTKIHISQLK